MEHPMLFHKMGLLRGPIHLVSEALMSLEMRYRQLRTTLLLVRKKTKSSHA